MADRIYLDWNATTPLRSEAREAMLAALALTGNPSSVHGEGRQARRLVEVARRSVARAVGADPASVVFTSGGTEANALALAPTNRHERLLMSAIEHPSVLAGGRFHPGQIEMIGVTPAGVVDLDSLRAQLASGPALVSIMLANNESGAIQPIADVAGIVHAAGGLLHVDAIQALGKIPIDIKMLGADMLSLSAHKIGGPQGIGALVLADAVARPEPVLRGGGQEQGRRAGTENVAAIAGFGAAADAAIADLDDSSVRIDRLRDMLEAGLRGTPGCVIFAKDAPRLPNTTLFSVQGLRAETAVIGFDLAGVAVSSGSACSSGKVQPSHVLAAMDVAPDLAQGAIRLSLGWNTTEEDVQGVIEAWRKLSDTLLKHGDETRLERF